MTTLYDIPNQNREYYSTSDSEMEDDVFELNEYDLDVVDDALLNPNNSEYLDHFGFKIHVRTDDESSSDDDSDYDEKPNSNNKPLTSDDDSVDTNLATPHDGGTNHSKKEFSKTNNSSSLPNTIPILKSPPSPRPDVIQTTRASNESRHSIFNNPFKSNNNRPASVISVQSPVISRPSQTFQQRQSKRYSEIPHHLSGSPRSPASNHKNFDKLVSKFRRFSHNDHQYDSEKHLQLKEEALAELQIYREKGGIENNSIDWGKGKKKYKRACIIEDLRFLYM